jgi:hypothetical protein
MLRKNSVNDPKSARRRRTFRVDPSVLGEWPDPHATVADAAGSIDLVARFATMAAGIGTWTLQSDDDL